MQKRKHFGVQVDDATVKKFEDEADKVLRLLAMELADGTPDDIIASACMTTVLAIGKGIDPNHLPGKASRQTLIEAVRNVADELEKDEYTPWPVPFAPESFLDKNDVKEVPE